MTLNQRIQAFALLGIHLEQLPAKDVESLAERARQENPWFTKENFDRAINGVRSFLKASELAKWTNNYSLVPFKPKTIALVMAGNIPLVGFHDFLSVLISGHRVQIKLSTKDSVLLTYLIKQLVSLESSFAEAIAIKDRLENFDAIIATGSDNSARYFESYFGKYPNIIRKNRTSCAIITGDESDNDIEKLGTDIFSYFGLGCRNVSKIYVPSKYNLTKLLSHWDLYKEIIHHNKYCNNYDYQKSLLLLNRTPFLDNGFILLQENKKLVSPISVLYYEYYQNEATLKIELHQNADRIQCVVGNSNLATIPFGHAQYPSVWDYADQIDTLKFLSELKV